MTSVRSYDRKAGDLRPTTIEPGFVRTASGSALISVGETRVICTASAEESVPRWRKGSGLGWVTAEYGMLPASTGERKRRDKGGKQDGRSVEIQRLIGRAVRGVVDFSALGENSIYLDCDVLQADGGTRCASITGAYVALALAVDSLLQKGAIERNPLTQSVAAVSAGIVDGEALLDLDYPEDSSADVDANVVMTGDGGLVEVQATAERTPLSRANLNELLELADSGITELRKFQDEAIAAGEVVKLVLASRNAHKVSELEELLAPHELEGLPEAVSLPPEDGLTFTANALDKARAAAAALGRPAIGDDSGIESAALDGAPGVRSARYAGEDATDSENLDKFIREVPAGSAIAYVCVLAYVDERGAEHSFAGRCTGVMASHPRGQGGFGYDPIFLPDDYDDDRTMAELDPAEKHAISHRGRAAAALLEFLNAT